MDETITPNQNIIPKKRKFPKKTIFMILLVLSLALNVFLILKNSNLTGNAVSLDSLKYTHPLEVSPIDSNTQGTELILHYNGLKEILEREIKNSQVEGSVGVFVQDAKTGAWIGINEKIGFAPASLLKIPIMMAILKEVERNEMSLNDKVTIIAEDINSEYGEIYKAGPRTTLTISQLLEEMVAASDNTAKNALKRQLSETEINSVFVHVGIPNPYLQGNDQTVSPRAYTRIFKSLYFSTFLSPKLSELALEIATDGREENLISSSIPSEIQVSHKFGITSVDLHDCGIIYHPKNPYFLCVMTEDLDLGHQQYEMELIQKISKDVYDFVDSKS